MNFKSLRQVLGMVLATAVFVVSTVFAASPAMAANVTVTMGQGGLVFAPKSANVSPGDTVTFKMGMLGPHNVVFEDATLNAAAKEAKADKMMMKPTDKAVITIPDVAPGKYSFYCTPHRGAGMQGTLVVE